MTHGHLLSTFLCLLSHTTVHITQSIWSMFCLWCFMHSSCRYNQKVMFNIITYWPAAVGLHRSDILMGLIRVIALNAQIDIYSRCSFIWSRQHTHQLATREHPIWVVSHELLYHASSPPDNTQTKQTKHCSGCLICWNGMSGMSIPINSWLHKGHNLHPSSG